MACASRFGSIPSGRLWAVNAPKAMAAMSMLADGVPRTTNVPASKSKSSSAASSWWAAMARALSMIFSVAM